MYYVYVLVPDGSPLMLTSGAERSAGCCFRAYKKILPIHPMTKVTGVLGKFVNMEEENMPEETLKVDLECQRESLRKYYDSLYPALIEAETCAKHMRWFIETELQDAAFEMFTHNGMPESKYMEIVKEVKKQNLHASAEVYGISVCIRDEILRVRLPILLPTTKKFPLINNNLYDVLLNELVSFYNYCENNSDEYRRLIGKWNHAAELVYIHHYPKKNVLRDADNTITAFATNTLAVSGFLLTDNPRRLNTHFISKIEDTEDPFTEMLLMTKERYLEWYAAY